MEEINKFRVRTHLLVPVIGTDPYSNASLGYKGSHRQRERDIERERERD